jgi:hypothetical protein
VIVSRRDGALALVRQVDHQTQCGLMARAWGNAEFGRPDPYEPMIVAADRHDEGWRSWEDAPQVDGDGHPVDFPDLDRSVHMRLYGEGIARAVEADHRAGLLVSMHGQGLYEKRLGLDGVAPPRITRPAEERTFIEGQERLQAALRAGLGDGPALREWAWAGYRLLQAWDVLSLYLTWRGLSLGESWSLPQVPRHAGDFGATLRLAPDGPDACTVDPWPFALDEVPLPVRGRLVEDRPYRDDDDLRATLDAAAWTTFEFSVRRLAADG